MEEEEEEGEVVDAGKAVWVEGLPLDGVAESEAGELDRELDAD